MFMPPPINGMERNCTRRAILLAGLPFWPFQRGKAKLAGVHFEMIRNGSSKRRYLLIHGNEETAREVLRAHMKAHRGVAYLVTGKQRLVPLGNGVLDPNRMYSREGAERNLKTLNPQWNAGQLEAELARLDRERERLIRALLPPTGGVTVAVHNNSSGYSVRAEVGISDEAALNDDANPHEFFLATAVADFRILARSPYNAVLQNKTPREDDGSLSRLMAKRGVRYVNLEVGLGKFERQKEMLEWLERNLP